MHYNLTPGRRSIPQSTCPSDSPTVLCSVLDMQVMRLTFGWLSIPRHSHGEVNDRRHGHFGRLLSQGGAHSCLRKWFTTKSFKCSAFLKPSCDSGTPPCLVYFTHKYAREPVSPMMGWKLLYYQSGMEVVTILRV